MKQIKKYPEILLMTNGNLDEDEIILQEYLNISTSEERTGETKTEVSKDNATQNKCPECGKEFQFASHVKLHIDMMHRGIQAFVCDQCNHQLSSEQRLKLHIEKVHMGIRHPCDQCEKVFTQKNHLDEHVRKIHVGMKYPCDKENSIPT